MEKKSYLRALAGRLLWYRDPGQLASIVSDYAGLWEEHAERAGDCPEKPEMVVRELRAEGAIRPRIPEGLTAPVLLVSLVCVVLFGLGRVSLAASGVLLLAAGVLLPALTWLLLGGRRLWLLSAQEKGRTGLFFVPLLVLTAVGMCVLGLFSAMADGSLRLDGVDRLGEKVVAVLDILVLLSLMLFVAAVVLTVVCHTGWFPLTGTAVGLALVCVHLKHNVQWMGTLPPLRWVLFCGAALCCLGLVTSLALWRLERYGRKRGVR